MNGGGPGPVTATILAPAMDEDILRDFGYSELSRHLSSLGMLTSLAITPADSGDGFVLADSVIARGVIDSWVASDPPRGARTLILNADRSTIFDLLEHYNLAGAITSPRFAEWLSDPENDRHAGIIGLRTVARELGWPVSSGPVISSERYCYMFDPTRRGLPTELANYLTALSESAGPMLSSTS
jgi:hypothetical protein